MLKAAADADDRDSIDEGLLFLKPLSVLLRCRPGRTGSNDAVEEPVLVREWLLTFLVNSFSRNEAAVCVSYGSLGSSCFGASCVE